MLVAIDILKSKQAELISNMTDDSKTNTQKLAYTMMYDDLSEAIKILDKAFFERNVPNKNSMT